MGAAGLGWGKGEFWMEMSEGREDFLQFCDIVVASHKYVLF